MMEKTVFLAPLYLAFASRLHGSTAPTPKVLEGLIYSAPYAAMVYLAHGWIFALMTAAWVTGFKDTGTADGFKDYVRDNSTSPISAWIAARVGIDRNSQAYDAIFWLVKAGLTALLPAILLKSLPIFLASAIGYPVAYWLFYNVRALHSSGIAWDEILGGFFAGLGFII